MLDQLQDFKDNKDMDAIAETIYAALVANGLTMAEVAALNYYIAQKTVKAPHNAMFLKERMGLDVSELGVEGIYAVQQALTKVYIGGFDVR